MKMNKTQTVYAPTEARRQKRGEFPKQVRFAWTRGLKKAEIVLQRAVDGKAPRISSNDQKNGLVIGSVERIKSTLKSIEQRQSGEEKCSRRCQFRLQIKGAGSLLA